MKFINKIKNPHKYKLFIIFIFQNNLLLILCSNYISFKLENYNNNLIKNIPEESFTFEHFINLTIQNNIYTSIKIGTPKQEIKVWIDSDEYSYFLYKNTCILESYFNENISLTFESNEKETFFYKGYGEAIYINETFILNDNVNEKNKEIKINKFPIMFMRDPKNDKRFNQIHSIEDITNKTCATIGFSYMPSYNDKNSKNFIISLKEKEIIDDYIIFIEYDNNGNEKFLIVGGFPEEIFNNQYSIKRQYTTYIKFYYEYIYQWGLNFDKISSGEEGKIYQVDAAFHYNLGVIYAVKEYQSYIEKAFFNYYLNLKICEKLVYKSYCSYVCDKDKFNYDEMKKFPDLKFIKADIEETFILTYEDLFFIKGNKVYFLVVFHNILNKVWELGKPFLKKYSFAFNFDSKIIWYYKKDNYKENDINNNPYKNSYIKYNIILFLIIIILSIALGVLCFSFGRIIYKKNKKKLIKAEELNDDLNIQNYEYKNIN